MLSPPGEWRTHTQALWVVHEPPAHLSGFLGFHCCCCGPRLHFPPHSFLSTVAPGLQPDIHHF